MSPDFICAHRLFVVRFSCEPRISRSHDTLFNVTHFSYSPCMTTYKDSGVDIEAGNTASTAAYNLAKTTFPTRNGAIGAAVVEDGGFAGLLDMGEFYLVQNDDGTGSKMEVALAVGKLDTLGYDLLAMVVDDAICTGAEVISVSNTLDVPQVSVEQVSALLKGLSDACIEQKIVLPGGEIAEVPGAVNSLVWNATSVGVVGKDRVIDTGTIIPGDTVISLRAGVARSNGFSLIRKILNDAFGDNWHTKEWRNGTSWGEIVLTPSVIYHAALLQLLGRYNEERTVDVKGLAHITGGGIAENFRRILKKSGFGADLHSLWEPHDALKDLIQIGNVPLEEAYRTWNMGNGMLMVVSPDDVDTSLELLQETGIEAAVAGTITEQDTIAITSYESTPLA